MCFKTRRASTRDYTVITHHSLSVLAKPHKEKKISLCMQDPMDNQQALKTFEPESPKLKFLSKSQLISKGKCAVFTSSNKRT